MGQVTNEVLLTAILELKGDVGSLLGKVEGQGATLVSHTDDITVLKVASAERRGASRIAHAVTGSVAGVLGAAITAWFKNHG